MLNNKQNKNSAAKKGAGAIFLIGLIFAVLVIISIFLQIFFQGGILFAATNTFNGIGINFIITGVCTPVLSNTLINFGTVTPGSFASTANVETVSDIGSVSSNIVLYSTSSTTGNWVSGSLSFLTGNTLWNPTSGGNIGTQLTNTIATDTQVLVPARSSNNLFFGLNVPVGQVAGTYTQGITVSLSC